MHICKGREVKKTLGMICNGGGSLYGVSSSLLRGRESLKTLCVLK